VHVPLEGDTAVNLDVESLYEFPESLYEGTGSHSFSGYMSSASLEGMGSIGGLQRNDEDSLNSHSPAASLRSVCPIGHT